LKKHPLENKHLLFNFATMKEACADKDKMTKVKKCKQSFSSHAKKSLRQQIHWSSYQGMYTFVLYLGSGMTGK
jgi:hypothetical protein